MISDSLAWTNHGMCLDVRDGVLEDPNNQFLGPQLWQCTDNDANQVWSTVTATNVTSAKFRF